MSAPSVRPSVRPSITRYSFRDETLLRSKETRARERDRGRAGVLMLRLSDSTETVFCDSITRNSPKKPLIRRPGEEEPLLCFIPPINPFWTSLEASVSGLSEAQLVKSLERLLTAT